VPIAIAGSAILYFQPPRRRRELVCGLLARIPRLTPVRLGGGESWRRQAQHRRDRRGCRCIAQVSGIDLLLPPTVDVAMGLSADWGGR
jgi:hypothetical protein